MDWKTRLKNRRSAHPIYKVKSKFADAVGVSAATVTDWEKPVEDGGIQNISGPNLVKVCELLGLNEIWLMEEVGDPDRVTAGQTTSGYSRRRAANLTVVPFSNIEDGPDIRQNKEYPVISWVQAGNWTEICNNFAPGAAEDWWPSHKNLGKHGYILRVKGKSMTSPEGDYSFPEGYLLFVNPEAEPLPGKFVIVRRKGGTEAVFKKLVQGDNGLLLEAINPTWPNRYLKLEEGDQFCGVVIHSGRDMP